MEELLAERSTQVSYEAIRLWRQRFGPAFAAGLHRRRARAGPAAARLAGARNAPVTLPTRGPPRIGGVPATVTDA